MQGIRKGAIKAFVSNASRLILRREKTIFKPRRPLSAIKLHARSIDNGIF